MTVIGRTLGKSTGVRALWRNRSTLLTLVQRDLAVKYQRSVLGYFWSLIEPMGMAAIYYFVFGILYNHAGSNVDGGDYAVFVVSGIFAWQWASSAMSESTRSLTSQSSLITTMRVPREIFPVAKVIARFAEFAAGVPIIILFALFLGDGFQSSIWALPVAVLLQTCLLVGLAFILGSVNVLMRDVERFMRLAMRVLFYAAPIIYPLSKVLGDDANPSNVPGWLQGVYMANPYVGIIQLHHAAWNPSELPSWGLFGYTAAVCVVVLFLGWALFKKLENSVLKEL
ncbi:ABC transporter permease [Phytomonospora sp. NPDC050363]|uniref:ABC transporter permease n=1 Tax=Phytomonospora sp. NPDC050363 TaxID=3155642 RepID=UPI0033CFB360